jgi:hypothetical protein
VELLQVAKQLLLDFGSQMDSPASVMYIAIWWSCSWLPNSCSWTSVLFGQISSLGGVDFNLVYFAFFQDIICNSQEGVKNYLLCSLGNPMNAGDSKEFGITFYTYSVTNSEKDLAFNFTVNT